MKLFCFIVLLLVSGGEVLSATNRTSSPLRFSLFPKLTYIKILNCTHPGEEQEELLDCFFNGSSVVNTTEYIPGTVCKVSCPNNTTINIVCQETGSWFKEISCPSEVPVLPSYTCFEGKISSKKSFHFTTFTAIVLLLQLMLVLLQGYLMYQGISLLNHYMCTTAFENDIFRIRRDNIICCIDRDNSICARIRRFFCWKDESFSNEFIANHFNHNHCFVHEQSPSGNKTTV